MSMNKVKLSNILADFKITQDDDDYASNISEVALRNIALRGIREIGFDFGNKIKSIKMTISDTDTVSLPEDFVDIVKIGAVGEDGLIRVFGVNNNINVSRKVTDPAATSNFSAGPLDLLSNSVNDREDSKTSTTTSSLDDDYYEYVFDNYMFNGADGRLYGLGGGQAIGEYRMNLDQNRIEIKTSSNFTEVVLEYVADEARSSDPYVHVFAEEALRAYMYYKVIERKSSVPSNEKARARAEFYNERRKASARINSFTKEDALRVIRKNFKQSNKV